MVTKHILILGVDGHARRKGGFERKDVHTGKGKEVIGTDNKLPKCTGGSNENTYPAFAGRVGESGFIGNDQFIYIHIYKNIVCVIQQKL